MSYFCQKFKEEFLKIQTYLWNTLLSPRWTITDCGKGERLESNKLFTRHNDCAVTTSNGSTRILIYFN